MNDKKFRPEIVKADIDMSAYDTVILGFDLVVCRSDNREHLP